MSASSIDEALESEDENDLLLPLPLGIENIALARIDGIGVRLTDGLPMWYSAASGEPKATVFLVRESGAYRLFIAEFKILLGAMP